jgi:hypothetical protein
VQHLEVKKNGHSSVQEPDEEGKRIQGGKIEKGRNVKVRRRRTREEGGSPREPMREPPKRAEIQMLGKLQHPWDGSTQDTRGKEEREVEREQETEV